ncbi:MAG: hypothetical protein Q9226_008410 [Calogaya cf. arnoldii]
MEGILRPRIYPSNLAFGHPFHPGLGSLSTLPPEIRSQIWEKVLPKTDKCFSLEPLKNRNWTVLATRQAKGRQTLAFARASKHLYREIIAQFFHKRSLAVIFTTAQFCQLEHRQDNGQQCTSMRGIMVNSEKLAKSFSATNFADFDSIKLLIEVPDSFYIMGDYADQLVKYVQAFSVCVQDWQEGMGLYASRLSIDIVLYIGYFDSFANNYPLSAAPPPEPLPEAPPGDNAADFGGFGDLGDIDWVNDEIPPESIEIYPSLWTIAYLLQPLRDIQKAEAVTIEADFELHFGQEWLSELFGQVADDTKKAGKTMPGPWRWRQKNMEVALNQSEYLTQHMPNCTHAAADRTLPIGPPG